MLVEDFLGGQQDPKPLQTLRQTHNHLHLLYIPSVCMLLHRLEKSRSAWGAGGVPEARSGASASTPNATGRERSARCLDLCLGSTSAQRSDERRVGEER